MMKIVAALVLCVIGWSISYRASAQSAEAEYLSSEATKKLALPFSEAVKVGNVLYLSGMVGISPGTMKVVPGGIEAETKQALENIGGLLEKSGSSLDQVVKCTVMMADIAEWSKMNAVYVTFFHKHFPARSAMGVAGLALGARVEIECVATVGSATH